MQDVISIHFPVLFCLAPHHSGIHVSEEILP